MHTTLQRRAVRRRNSRRLYRGQVAGKSAGGLSILAVLAIGLPLLIFASFVTVSAGSVMGVMSAYDYYARDLPDPRKLEQLSFSMPSVIYDRTGKIELAQVGVEQRELVKYDQIPPVVLDATTSIEDKDFWTNPGFDPFAIVSAGLDSLNGNARGASTITQQLVRQRLLDPALVQDPNRQVERKAKEIIQSIRLTEDYPGDEGKRKIITTYLNQNYYGSQLYGVKAAAKGYFGVDDLDKLTLAQAAILAAIPKSPSAYDLRRNAVTQDDGTIVVPSDTEIVQRRNYVLELMRTRAVLTKGEYTDADFDAAKQERVVLVPEVTPNWIAPHFVWQVREEMSRILCGDQTESCTALETGGYTIITTLDVKMQKSAEKWVAAAAIVPKAKDPRAAAKAIGMTYQPWMQRLRGENVYNGALIAMDYTNGEVMAYVGSADYYATKSSKKFQPKFDVLADGWRQPGSAFKPIHYSIGIDDQALTAASGFMDVTTDFGGGWAPTDSDNLERGPLRLRGALQWSLNIPAIKAIYTTGVDRVFAVSQKMGLRYQGQAPTAGLSMGIGTEVVHPADLTQGYATIANGGAYVPRVTVLKVTDPNGKNVYTYSPPKKPELAITPQAAYIMTDILKGNTDPSVNPAWGRFNITQNGKRRPATLKTGTNDEARDLGAYGFIAPSKDDAKYPSLVVGVWNGNSDYSILGKIFSFDAPTYVWQGFLKDVTKGWPVTEWKEPDGIVHASVDAFTGMRPGPYSRQTVDEIFIKGTVPKQVDDTKVAGCGGGVLDFSRIEADKPASWQVAIDDWVSRARRGSGVEGGVNKDIPTKTAYFVKPYFHPYGETWGGSFSGNCHDKGPKGSESPGNGGGNGGGGGGQPSQPPTCHGKHCKPRRRGA
jgi:penicillin-binding protein 1A